MVKDSCSQPGVTGLRFESHQCQGLSLSPLFNVNALEFTQLYMEAEKGSFTRFHTPTFRNPQLAGCRMRDAEPRNLHPAKLEFRHIQQRLPWILTLLDAGHGGPQPTSHKVKIQAHTAAMDSNLAGCRAPRPASRKVKVHGNTLLCVLEFFTSQDAGCESAESSEIYLLGFHSSTPSNEEVFHHILLYQHIQN